MQMAENLFLLLIFVFSSRSESLLFGPRNPEVLALISVKEALDDPHGALNNWDEFSVDPCSWTMVTCSSENVVISLGAPSQSLAGALSPAIGNLTNLRQVLLQNNNISGKIPPEIGGLHELQTLDLSNNRFSGEVPYTLGLLSDLHYLRLNNNTLTGLIPSSLAKIAELTFLDLSYNNLRGPVPKLNSKTFSVSGNPRICGGSSYGGCFRSASSFSLNSPAGRSNTKRIVLALAISFIVVFLLLFVLGFIIFRRKSVKNQTVLNINDQQEQGLIGFGNIKTFNLRELQLATDNFHPRNILGSGGFGNVYRGKLGDGMIIAVKRLKDLAGAAGEAQFRTELGMISLAVHRNLLRLIGYCATPSERLLIYPYMSNGSVDSRLRGKPILDWNTRKRIAIGAARGLLYLHEQCDPKIIHRDVKAANVLLDDYFEPIVGDFGLAKLLDHDESHVTTAVRGTVGHIAPEYLSTGQSSEKTDVFGFGILLLELVTGMRALQFGKSVNQKGAIVEWVRKIQEEKTVEMLVDRELEVYDKIEVGEILQVAVLCTQYLPANRPKMAEVLQMLEGDGVVVKWATSRGLCNQIAKFSQSRRSDGFLAGGNVSGHGGDETDQTSMLGGMTDLEEEDDDDATLQNFAIELSGPR